jgi:hypothetical protein
MPTITRLLPWPPSFLPRRSAAAAGGLPISGSGQSAVAQAADRIGLARSHAEPTSEPAEAVSARRSQALRAMFPLLFSKHARRSDLWKAIVVERYLSQATNIANLEQRIREVERRHPLSWKA